MNSIKKYFELFSVFFKIGLVTFGGGIAMLPVLERELVVKKKWITSDELLDYFAIGQSTPGIIAVNTATFVGFKQAKDAGGIFATIGVVCPSVLIISVLAALIDNIGNFELAKKALAGINVGVAAILTYAFINFSKKSIKSFSSLFILLLAFSLIYFLKVPSWIIIAGSALSGVLIYFVKKQIQNKRRS